MTQDEWKSLKHFKSDENWGDPSLMLPELVFELDAMREYSGIAMFVSYGTQGEHVKTSLHYPQNNPDGFGHAVDILFPGKPPRAILDLFIMASRFKWTGIGLYTGWELTKKPTAGMHLEMGSYSPRKYWLGVTSEGEQVYESFSVKEMLVAIPDAFSH